MSEIWNLSTLCRCCHSDGLYKSLKQAYDSENGVEVYETLLRDILDITISQPQIEASYSICDTCVQRLKDAALFKKQVLSCETKFLVYCTNELFVSGNGIDDVKSEVHSQISDDEAGDHFSEDTFQRDENISSVVVKEEQFTIEVDFNNPIENKNRDIKIEDEKCKNDVDVKNDEENVKEEIAPPSMTKKKRVLQKKTRIIKENKLIGNKKRRVDDDNQLEQQKINMNIKEEVEPIDTAKRQRQKARLKLLNSYILQVNTETGVTYSCKNCAGRFKSKEETLKHIRLQHIARFKCEQCGKPFPHEYTLRIHMKNVHNNELYQCCHCKKAFTNKSNLKIHENTHTKELTYKCEDCNKLFFYRSTLTKHIKRMHTPGFIYNKLICDVCGLSFYDRTNMEIHIKTVHLKQRPFACSVCGKTYTAKKHVKEHMKVHSGNPKPYQCDECPKNFACVKSLNNHKINFHADQTSFACKYCSSVFDSKKELALHTRCHNESLQNPLTCHICFKTLMSKFTLNRHLDIHKGIKRFSCDICGVKFTQKALVERHRRRKHDPNMIVEKVKCLQCKIMVRNIDRHMATHDDEKRFYCDICGKSYAKNTDLTRHKKHAHFGVSFDCVYCGKKYINKRSLASHEVKVHKVKREIIHGEENRDEYSVEDAVA